jgi:hypothetical protein
MEFVVSKIIANDIKLIANNKSLKAFKLLCISHVLRTSHHDDKTRVLSLSMASLGHYAQIM